MERAGEWAGAKFIPETGGEGGSSLSRAVLIGLLSRASNQSSEMGAPNKEYPDRHNRHPTMKRAKRESCRSEGVSKKVLKVSRRSVVLALMRPSQAVEPRVSVWRSYDSGTSHEKERSSYHHQTNTRLAPLSLNDGIVGTVQPGVMAALEVHQGIWPSR